MSVYYDRKGNPMSEEEWQAAINSDYQILKKDRVGASEISTIWLGVDDQLDGGPPLIFETVVFGGNDDEYQRAYSTEDEAMRGHEEIVGRIKAKIPLEPF